MPSDLPSIIEAKIDKAYASGGYGLTETLASEVRRLARCSMQSPTLPVCSHRLWIFVAGA